MKLILFFLSVVFLFSSPSFAEWDDGDRSPQKTVTCIYGLTKASYNRPGPYYEYPNIVGTATGAASLAGHNVPYGLVSEACKAARRNCEGIKRNLRDQYGRPDSAGRKCEKINAY